MGNLQYLYSTSVIKYITSQQFEEQDARKMKIVPLHLSALCNTQHFLTDMEYFSQF